MICTVVLKQENEKLPLLFLNFSLNRRICDLKAGNLG